MKRLKDVFNMTDRLLIVLQRSKEQQNTDALLEQLETQL